MEISSESKTKYEIQVVAEGTCPDSDYAMDYEIDTVVFRGNGYVTNDWIDSEPMDSPESYHNYSQYLDYIREKERARTEWTDRILKLFKWTNGTIYHNCAEIFTAVRITEASGELRDNTYIISE